MEDIKLNLTKEELLKIVAKYPDWVIDYAGTLFDKINNDTEFLNRLIKDPDSFETPEVILKSIAYLFNISLRELKSKTKKREITSVRNIYFLICMMKKRDFEKREILYDELAKLYTLRGIGLPVKRDHATVLHGIKTAISDAEYSVKYQEMIAKATNFYKLESNIVCKLKSNPIATGPTEEMIARRVLGYTN